MFFVDRREIVAEFSWNCCKATLDNGEHKECMLLSNYIVLTNNRNSIETPASIFINIPQSARYTVQPATLVSIMYFVCVHFTKLVGSKMLISILISPSPPSGLLCSCFTMLRLYQSLDNIWRSRILVHPTLPICIQTT